MQYPLHTPFIVLHALKHDKVVRALDCSRFCRSYRDNTDDCGKSIWFPESCCSVKVKPDDGPVRQLECHLTIRFVGGEGLA
jgi:hypothetical protein